MFLLGCSFCLYESANFHSQQAGTQMFTKMRCTYFWIFSYLKIRIHQRWLKSCLIHKSFYWIYYRWSSQRMKFVFNGSPSLSCAFVRLICKFNRERDPKYVI